MAKSVSTLLTGTHVPTRISAPAAAKDFAIAQPYPLSSATPAMNALLPLSKSIYYLLSNILYQIYIKTTTPLFVKFVSRKRIKMRIKFKPFKSIDSWDVDLVSEASDIDLVTNLRNLGRLIVKL